MHYTVNRRVPNPEAPKGIDTFYRCGGPDCGAIIREDKRDAHDDDFHRRDMIEEENAADIRAARALMRTGVTQALDGIGYAERLLTTLTSKTVYDVEFEGRNGEIAYAALHQATIALYAVLHTIPTEVTP